MAVWLEDTADLGQVRVETGTGLVEEVAAAGGRNAKVTIKATHHNFRDPVVAWADMTDSAVWPAALKAADDRFEVEYRVEVKRKPSAPRETPIAELGSRDKIRELAAIARKGELGQADRTPPASAAAAPEEEPAPAEPSRRGPRVEEGRPWELYNTDRSLNLGSYSYQGTVETVELAHHLLTRHDQEQRSTGEDPGEFNLRKVEGRGVPLGADEGDGGQRRPSNGPSMSSTDSRGDRYQPPPACRSTLCPDSDGKVLCTRNLGHGGLHQSVWYSGTVGHWRYQWTLDDVHSADSQASGGAL